MNRLLLALGLALLLVPPVSGTEQTAIDTARLTRVEDFSETLANRFHRLSADLIRGEGQAWSAWLAPDFAADNWPTFGPVGPTQGWTAPVAVTMTDTALDGSRFATAWGDLVSRFAPLEDMRFKIKQARYSDDPTPRASIDLYFFMVGRTPQGQRQRFEGKARVQAARSGPPAEPWSVEDFHFKYIKADTAPRDLFNEVSLPAGLYLEAPAFGAPGNQGFSAPGAAVHDIDGDNDLDIAATGTAGILLYLNNGDGTFSERGTETGLRPSPRASAPLFLDYDNDGDSDLFFATTGPQMLFENRLHPDGTLHFVDVSAEAGVDRGAQGYSAAADDVNGDGWPDIYVASYNRYGTIMPNSWSAATNGTPNLLFVNRGDGTYAEVGRRWGVNDSRWSYAAAFADLNGDGLPDLYVANDFGENAYFVNHGDRFADQAAAAGLLDPGNGMGVSIGDYDNDGLVDLHVTNMSSTAGNRILRRLFPDRSAQLEGTLVLNKLAAGNSLFRNLGGGRFADVSDEAGPFSAGWAFGGGFLDFDNDGWQDLHAPNGFISGKDLKDT